MTRLHVGGSIGRLVIYGVLDLQEMILLYHQWRDHKPMQFDYSAIKSNITGAVNEENDVDVNDIMKW